MIHVERRNNLGGQRVFFRAHDDAGTEGYAWVRLEVTASRTGQDVGTVAELEIIETNGNQLAGDVHVPAVPITHRLLCEVLWYLIELAAAGTIEGLVMDVQNVRVERFVRHQPEAVRLAECPWLWLVRADDFEVLRIRHCNQFTVRTPTRRRRWRRQR